MKSTEAMRRSCTIFFDTARSYQDSFIDAPAVLSRVYTINVEIPDEAGSPGFRATLLALNHISIKISELSITGIGRRCSAHRIL